MIPCNLRKLAALVISLVIQVISLSGLAFAVTAPVATVRSLATDGLRAPVRIAKDPAGGYFYVTDPKAGGVLKMNYQRKVVQTIKTVGTPKGVAIGTAGATNGKILVSQGKFVSVIGQDGVELSKLGSGVGQFSLADGITVDAAGKIYVVDSVARAIKIFSSDGALLSTFTTWTGGLATTFTLPTGIAYEKVANQIAVTDTLGGYVYFFNISGNSLSTVLAKWTGYWEGWGQATGPLLFQSPTGVTFEYTAGGALNRMYVVDSFQGSLQAIDPATGSSGTTGTGTYLSTVGSYGKYNGQLMVPYDAMYDDVNKLLLVTNGNSNITAYGIDGGDWPVTCLNGPTIGFTPPTDIAVSSPSLVVTGTTTNANTVRLTSNTAAVASAVTPPVGSWSSTITGLVPGANIITATTDAGLCSPASALITVTYTPTGAVVINPAPSQYTNNPSVTLTGTMPSGAAVTCTNTTTSIGVPATPTTATTFSCVVALVNNANIIDVTATKSGYIIAPALPVTINLDTAAPVLSVSAISGGSSTSTQLQNVTGTVADAHLAATVSVNGYAATVTSGIFGAPVILANGQNAIEVKATDLAGNETTNIRFVSFDFDPERPVITVDTPADSSYTLSPSILLSGMVTNAAQLSVSGMPVTINANNTWSHTVSALAAGMNTVEIVATSLTGSTSSVKRTVFYEINKPAASLTSPLQDLATNSVNDLAVTGTVSSGTVTATFNGIPKTVNRNGSNFSANLVLPSDGTYPLVLSVDNGGNISTVVRSIVIDRAQPALTVDVATSTATTLRGTAEAGDAARIGTAKVNILDNGATAIGTVTLNTDGKWVADMTGVTYDLSKATAQATDVAGNTSSILLQPAVKDGDVNLDRLLTTNGDALYCLRTYVADGQFTLREVGHGDCAPLNSGVCSPDGKIDLPDCMVILRCSVGLLPCPLQPVP